MRRALYFLALLAMLVSSRVPVMGGFSALYAFGDGLSTTTNLHGQSSSGPPEFYGQRFSNGRVWVEVLAQRLGLPIGADNNWSFFGHYSSNLLLNASAYIPGPDPTNTLFVVWVNNADFVDFVVRPGFSPYASNNITIWTNAINQSVSNHLKAIDTLYNKGARTLVMPNAVDIMKVPFYSGLPSASRAFIRERIIDFNARFLTALKSAQDTRSGLTIVVPDFFSLTDAVVAQPPVYGFTNAASYALFALTDKSFTGPGTNFVFWDYLHPTAKVHEILADTALPLIAPTRIAGIVPVGSSNRLSILNVPIGLNGHVEGSGNLAGWLPVSPLSSTNSTQSILVPASGPSQFYRLRFPFAWTWP